MKNADDSPEVIRQGQLFSVAESQAQENNRQAFEFTPTSALDTAPDSMVGVTAKIGAASWQTLQLEALPIKGLKQTLGCLGLMTIGLLCWQWVRALETAYAMHPLWGLACMLATTAVASLSSYCLWQVWRQSGQLDTLKTLQISSETLRQHKSFGKAAAYIQRLQSFYQSKPQISLLEKALTQLPDYSNDAETLNHIERVFLVPLDQEALRRVAKYASQTSIAVAASPWATLDMLISLARNLKMINEIGQVYGVRPSLLNHYRLLRQVITHLVGSGASEIIVDQAIQDFGASGLAKILGLRLTQGVGAGLYCAKIGLSAIAVTRPINFVDAEKPKLIQLLNGILLQIKSVFTGT